MKKFEKIIKTLTFVPKIPYVDIFWLLFGKTILFEMTTFEFVKIQSSVKSKKDIKCGTKNV